MSLNRKITTGVFVDTGKAHAEIAMCGTDADSNIRFFTTSTNNVMGTERVRICKDGTLDQCSNYLVNSQTINDGQIKNNFHFDGTNDYLDMGVQTIFNDVANFTITAWVCATNNNAAWSRIVSQQPLLLVGRHTDKITMLMSSDGANWDYPDMEGRPNPIDFGTFPINEWAHITYVKNGTTLCVFLNGAVSCVLESGEAGNAAPAELGDVTSTNIYVGSDSASGTQEWYGGVNRIRYWNRALTDTQIKEEYSGKHIYNDSNLKFEFLPKSVGSEDGLSYWLDTSGNGANLTNGGASGVQPDVYQSENVYGGNVSIGDEHNNVPLSVSTGEVTNTANKVNTVKIRLVIILPLQNEKVNILK